MNAVETAARTAWAEARDQGSAGMQAVLNTIGNRVADPGWWGHDITSVCLFQSRGIHQFSCWNLRDPNRLQALGVTDANPQYAAALLLARLLAAGDLSDLTNGADSYYAASCPRPTWATPGRLTAVIGAHRFYRVGVDGHGVAAETASGVHIS